MNKNNKPIILADVDGCLLEWTSKLPEYIKKRGYNPEKAIKAHSHGEYISHSEISGLPPDEAYQLMLDYNESEYIKYLTPYKDALAVVNLLKQDFDFIAVTAIGTSENSSKFRMQNLDFWYPNAFKDIRVVNMGASKTEILKEYERTYFIDDCPKHCAEGKAVGHISMRIVRDSRPDITNTLRFTDYYQIGSFIEATRQ